MDKTQKQTTQVVYSTTTTSPALALLKFIVHLTFKGKKAYLTF